LEGKNFYSLNHLRESQLQEDFFNLPIKHDIVVPDISKITISIRNIESIPWDINSIHSKIIRSIDLRGCNELKYLPSKLSLCTSLEELNLTIY
jgi:hypothetical protein